MAPLHPRAGLSSRSFMAQIGYHTLSIHIRNTSGKRIVGLVFNAALSDATERRKWLHWEYDPIRPLQNIGWNKPVKECESKKLSWIMIWIANTVAE